MDSRLAWLDASNSKIRARAAAALTDAVQTRQQQEIGAALQVFVALVARPEAVERAERELLKLAKAAVATALDTSTLGADGEGQARGARARGPANAAAAAGWKAELWERLEDLMEVLEGKLSQARPCRPPRADADLRRLAARDAAGGRGGRGGTSRGCWRRSGTPRRTSCCSRRWTRRRTASATRAGSPRSGAS